MSHAAPLLRPAAQQTVPTAFHVMTKPIGPICNLDCRYCFYLEKEDLYEQEKRKERALVGNAARRFRNLH